MSDFAHWDFAPLFSAHQAACLIVGIDPDDPHFDEFSPAFDALYRRVKPVHDALRASYGHALELCRVRHNSEWQMAHGSLLSALGERDLVSNSMYQLILAEFELNDEISIDEWIESGDFVFEQQKFHPDRLSRWLESHALPSKYAFRRAVAPDRPPQPEQKQLETKERNTLLCIIASLCKEAGVDYSKSAKAAGLIREIAHTKLGVALGESTIEGHLKKIANALESRTK